MLDFDELIRLEAAATKGPWVNDGSSISDADDTTIARLDEYVEPGCDCCGPYYDDLTNGVNNTALIVALRNAAPELFASALRWIPVTERLPELGQAVLMVDLGETTYGDYEPANRWFRHWTGALTHDVTHWMPLPAPPITEDTAHD